MPKRIKAKVGPVEAWAWIIRTRGYCGPWVLCHWASASRSDLGGDHKPSPEAKAIRVLITPILHSPRKGKKR